jgi:hypothetical protein
VVLVEPGEGGRVVAVARLAEKQEEGVVEAEGWRRGEGWIKRWLFACTPVSRGLSRGTPTPMQNSGARG